MADSETFQYPAKIAEESYAIAYSWFAEAHPHEAYANDPEMFWLFFQSRVPGVTREQMEKTLRETENLPA